MLVWILWDTLHNLTDRQRFGDTWKSRLWQKMILIILTGGPDCCWGWWSLVASCQVLDRCCQVLPGTSQIMSGTASTVRYCRVLPGTARNQYLVGNGGLRDIFQDVSYNMKACYYGLVSEQHQKRRCGLGLQISLNELRKQTKDENLRQIHFLTLYKYIQTNFHIHVYIL